MKTPQTSLFAGLLGLALFLAGAPSAEAVIRIYKVKVTAQATYFSENSFASTGYLIFDTNNPGASQTVQVVAKTKTFQVRTPGNPGGLLNVLLPGTLSTFVLDRNLDGINEIEGARGGFQGSGFSHAMGYIGAIPKNGFRIGNTTFFETARSLKGKGTVNISDNVPGNDFFTRSDTFTIDPLSATPLANADQGTALVIAQLLGKKYVQVP